MILPRTLRTQDYFNKPLPCAREDAAHAAVPARIDAGDTDRRSAVSSTPSSGPGPEVIAANATQVLWRSGRKTIRINHGSSLPAPGVYTWPGSWCPRSIACTRGGERHRGSGQPGWPARPARAPGEYSDGFVRAAEAPQAVRRCGTPTGV